MKRIFTLTVCLLLCNLNRVVAQVAGALDNTFNGTGRVTTTFGGQDGFGEAVAIQPDGKIVVAGYTGDGVNYEFAVARYDSSGALDNTFGYGGIVVTYFPDSLSYGYAVAIQPDGKIIVAGSCYNGEPTNTNFAMVRYNTNGTLDNTFGYFGYVITDFDGSYDEASSVVIQPDGKILLGGSSSIYNVPYDISSFALARYNTDGSLDNTFGSSGLVYINFYNSNNYGRSIALQSDGKIVLAGSSSDTGLVVAVALARYNTNGSLDSTFGTNGIDTMEIDSAAEANSLVIQQDGKLLVAGYAGNNFAVLRFTTAGALDTTFGIGGIDTTGFGTSVAVGNSIVIQPDSEIIVAGTTGSAFALARYKFNGTPDSTFGSNGRITTTFRGIDDEAYSVALQPDGKIVAAGYTEDDTVYLFAVARYIPTITLGIIDIARAASSAIVYPNPVYTEATLDYKLVKDENLNIKLYDITGHLLQSITSNTNMIAGEHRQVLNLTTLPAGNYIVYLTNTNSQNLSIKISKQ